MAKQKLIANKGGTGMKKILVEVNPYLEFMNSILLTSKYNEITKPDVGYGLMSEISNEYTMAIKKHFEPYLGNEIYRTLENMIPNGFMFSRPVELMLSLGKSNDFSMVYTPSDICIKLCGGMDNMKKFLLMLKQFAQETNYFAFFDTVSNHYNSFIDKVIEHTQRYPFIPLLEDEFGTRQNSYNCIISSLMVGNFGIIFRNDKTNLADLYSVVTTEVVSDDIEKNEFNKGALSANLVFHEFSHSFINPLTDKYFSIAEGYINAYESLKKYKLPYFESGYYDWKECINEHFVRAMAIHLLIKCDRQEWADEYLRDELRCGYLYIPDILERYKFYDQNRLKYRTFEDYYPQLLETFKTKID